MRSVTTTTDGFARAVMTGYAIDRVGFTAGATGFAVALTLIALAAGAAAVLALRHDND
ncbi:hypothetical protein [Burkholderia sp. D-99]|uniref:hypothetical protein n=1 Tax=Burkholderia sp. D-99 TaxID=2717316 RepID=UPI0014208648|nr:hypothetical protein [Burkholderia sp. D-99]NHV27110.1 hypothetical protein [Burkholderia sp. D-99]